MKYLGYQDPSRKPFARKIADAAARYEEKTGRRATLVLVNPKDLVMVDGLDVRAVAHVARHTMLVGEIG
jgi:hypothetical protein